MGSNPTLSATRIFKDCHKTAERAEYAEILIIYALSGLCALGGEIYDNLLV